MICYTGFKWTTISTTKFPGGICMMKKTVSLRRTAALILALLMLLSQPFSALAAYKTLEYGSRGTAVTEMQKALLSLGFDPKGTDGKFGSGTLAAVKAYQKSRGLKVDGKAGNLTLSLLYSELDNASGSAGSSGGTASTDTSTLKYGASGSRVTELQLNLKKLGYYTGTVDGKFGAGTQRAVVAFQSANKLTPDGLAGSQTLTLLNLLAANGDSSSGSTSSGSSSSGSSSGTTSGSATSDISDLTRTLRRGYTGADVTKVQTRLKALGYYTGTVDGVYGLGSMAAVKAFQERNGLEADGLAGKATFAVLFSSGAVAAGSSSSAGSNTNSSTGFPSTETYPRLVKGSKGEDVRRMQTALKALNYPVDVDGDFGPATHSAVVLFQGTNGLTADGVAGSSTLALLYSGNAKPCTGSSVSSGASSGTVYSSAGASAMGSFTGTNGKKIQLLHWFNEIKPSLKTGQNITVFDPATSITFTLYVMSRGRHCDVEPLTADDTARMMQAWGGVETWTPRAVYIGLPDGRWTLAVMHNVAHGSQVISGNNFDGQNCVHFLRDMSECSANDPDYGVTNQNALRKAWKNWAGVTVE